MEQGGDEWRRARCGKVTGSKFHDVVTGGQTAQRYLMDKIGERLTGRPSDEIKSKYLEWGNKHEPGARATYDWRSDGTPVIQVGFVDHPTIPMVGCSPDGLIGDDGTLEIKCPYTEAAHLRTLLTKTVPREYVYQVQGHLWVTGRVWCDFVSYHPLFPQHLRLAVVRVGRDEKSIHTLESKVTDFVDQIDRKIQYLEQAYAN